MIDPARMKAGSPETWAVPVCMSRPNAQGVLCELLTARQQVFTVPGCSPWVLGNAASRGHYRVAYASDDLGQIAEAVPRLGAPDQIALERDQWALVRAGRADVGEFLDIAQGLLQTDVPEVLRSVEGHLNYVDRHLATDANRDAFRAWVRAQYEPRLSQLGWEPQPGEPLSRKRMRAALLQLPGTEQDPKVLAEARRLAERTLADYGSVDPSIRDVAVSLAAAAGDAPLYERYRQKVAQVKTPAEYYLYFYSLALFPTPDLQRQTLAFALGPDVRAQDMGGLLATMVVDRASQPLAVQYVVDNWDAVRAKTPEGLYAAESMFAGVSGSFCSPEQREVVVRFFEQHPLKSNDRPLRRALESIDACIALKAREQAPFDAWVKKQGTK